MPKRKSQSRSRATKRSKENIPADLRQWKMRIEKLEDDAQAMSDARYFDGRHANMFRFNPGDIVIVMSEKNGFYFRAKIDRYRGAVKIPESLKQLQPAGSDAYIPTYDVEFSGTWLKDSIEVSLENEMISEASDHCENDFSLLCAHAWNEFRRELRVIESGGLPDETWPATWSLSPDAYDLLEQNWQSDFGIKMSFAEYCGKVIGHYRI